MKEGKDFANERSLMVIVEDTAVIKSQVFGIEIDSKESQSLAAGLIAKIKGHIKEIKSLHKTWIQSFKDVIAIANKTAREKIEPLEKLLYLISIPYKEYQWKLDKIAEEKELARLKERVANDKKIADLKKKEANAKTDRQQEKIQEKIEVAENAPIATPAKEKPTVKTESGSVSTQKRWTYEVPDVSKLDPEYLLPPQPDRAKLRKAVNNGVRDIKGVRIFQEMNLAGRT